jgi:DNA-directed RNA polymerase specialized sigma subunit
MKDLDLDSMLINWGVWHKTYLQGLNANSVNHSTASGSRATAHEGNNRVFFKEDPISEKLDMVIKHLRFVHVIEMKIVRDFYINDKSLRSIGTELGVSRGKVLKMLDHAKTLLESHYRVNLLRSGQDIY